MYELPVATVLAAESVRRRFDPTAPAEPDGPPRSFRRPAHRVRLATAAVLQRAARAIEPRPECTPAH